MSDKWAAYEMFGIDEDYEFPPETAEMYAEWLASHSIGFPATAEDIERMMERMIEGDGRDDHRQP